MIMVAIRKNSNSGIFLGVCSGFSEWSGVPVDLVRVLTTISILFSAGTVFLGYVAIAGVLTDTAECSMSKKMSLKDKFQLLFTPYNIILFVLLFLLFSFGFFCFN
jgi:phage shock protein PspC (stress-responsive transcriptional regulator)